MAKVDTYKCDQCGTLRGGTNHWFKVIRFYNSRTLRITPWDGLDGIDEGIECHLCSLACVIRFISDFFEPKEVSNDNPR